MIEKKFSFTRGNEKMIEKVISDENVMINHMVLPQGTGLPEHYSNSNVYMIIVRGQMSIKLGEQEVQIYDAGDIINIPFNIKMLVTNAHEDVLEFFVVKAPHPDTMVK
ncbi:cupin domain-containing protein [Geosporobacter ferrireducens]|uniref:Cupin 2 conserved barrel domain-containing protein n=1 Tax=Geosporobacter ferrireducens TaxID=1424294 RepID=A0A1D8GDH4_9FIRM|nr:cupin domain-containing protein [Geosporobacter ferrireducens]AOT68946.1 hypothetical protein Gferi_04880 [Geosporobacter ferrireducens]MTI54813.1 hypothetical protein [Geosporobacter ferrireducens]